MCLTLSFFGPCLEVAHNGGVGGVFHPMQLVLEAVALNSSLESLDVQANALDVDSAIVLEEGLVVHPRIARVGVDENPLGLHGLRAIARAVPACVKLSQEFESN